MLQIRSLQDYSPLCRDVSNPLPKDDHRNGKKHDQNVYSSLSSERVDIAVFCHPRDNAVQESEGDNVLQRVSISTLARKGDRLTLRPLTSSRASALTGR